MLLTLLVATLFSPVTPHASDDGMFRPLTYDAALAAAKSEQHVVMIDFFTTWCAPCKKLDATTWKDPAVLAWARETCVAIKLDAEQNVELAKRYKIESYPTMVFLRSDGTEIERVNGYKDAPTFLAEAKDLLAGKDAISRLREKLARHEKDYMLRGQLADALARRGKHEEALAEYLRCFDEGKDSPGYGGVRVSFLLADIAQLGAKYPPALHALEERRDAAETRLLADSNSIDDVQEFAALNKKLETPDRTLKFFDKLLEKGRPPVEMRSALVRHVLAPLVEARRYADALNMVDSPAGYVREKLKNAVEMERFTRGMGLESKDDSEEVRAMMESVHVTSQDLVVTECAGFVEALLGVQRKADTAPIVEQLLAFAPRVSTYVTLIQAAGRAGDIETAQALATRGSATATDKDKRAIERARKRAKSAK
jgi:thiol-disulfide isomerase/thioredoxin